MAMNHWSSLLLLFTLLLGILICCKQHNFLIMNEVRTFISIVFGFATSCLLLSFIWITQRKPAHDSPHGAQLTRDGLAESPSMHPAGRFTSLGSSGEHQHRHQQPTTVNIISSMLDLPPNYEDALITSKPVNWTYLDPKKACCAHSLLSNSHRAIQMKICLCAKHSNEYNETTSHHSDQNHRVIVSSRECIICTGELISSVVTSKNPTSNSIAQLAMSIVRGFTTLESAEQQQQAGRARLSQDNSNRRANGFAQQQRKLSFCQLNVNQLMLSSSPPKYCELVISGDQESSANLSNNSNEPRAADSRHTE